MLRLEQVSKRFWRGNARIVALDDVSLTIEPGEFVAVWGRTNAGKTMLLRVAAGIDPPDAGAVRFEGRDLAALSRRERTRLLRSEIGCVWRPPRVHHGASVVDYVALPLIKEHGRRRARGRALEALRAAGAHECAQARWCELADGDRARVAIAHALVRGPRLVLADEPTVHLNMIEREEVHALLRSLAQETGAAVLMTAPDAPETLQSHRIISIDRGRLIETRRPARGQVIKFPDAPGRASEHGA